MKSLFQKFSYTGIILTVIAIGGAVWLGLTEPPPEPIRVSKNLTITGWHYKRLRDTRTDTMKPTAAAAALHDEDTTYVLAAICHLKKFTISFGGIGFRWRSLGELGSQIKGTYQIDDEKPVKADFQIGGGEGDFSQSLSYGGLWSQDIFQATENGGRAIFTGSMDQLLSDLQRAKRIRFVVERANGPKIVTEFGTERVQKSINRVLKNCTDDAG